MCESWLSWWGERTISTERRAKASSPIVDVRHSLQLKPKQSRQHVLLASPGKVGFALLAPNKVGPHPPRSVQLGLFQLASRDATLSLEEEVGAWGVGGRDIAEVRAGGESEGFEGKCGGVSSDGDEATCVGVPGPTLSRA